eukprot:scaffold92277_cov30-Tisochrysis_lutea.AAC.3
MRLRPRGSSLRTTIPPFQDTVLRAPLHAIVLRRAHARTYVAAPTSISDSRKPDDLRAPPHSHARLVHV